MITWVRQSGSELKTNDFPSTVKYCLSKGFERKDSKPDESDAIYPYNEHKPIIEAMTEKDDIESYVKKISGIDIDKRGSLDTIKAKGLKAIEAWENGNS